MDFLIESKRQYDYLVATVAQGLTQLGHATYGFDGDFSNYLIPHEGQSYDIVIQAIEGTEVKSDKPRIYLQGEDLGIGPEMDSLHYRDLDYRIAFVRDLRATFNERRFVYPINFGVEDRYFCKTKKGYKPLHERKYDITFLGEMTHPDGSSKGLRQEIVYGIRNYFSDKNLLVGGKRFKNPDSFWSKWTKTFTPHDEEYFEVLADSKIVISPMGAGPDCARHWECLASGALTFIERMPSLMCPPELRNQRECIFFENIKELLGNIDWALKEIEKYQQIADKAYYMAKNHHSTKARAMYMLTKCMEAGVI
jgi:hypothetical protein